MKKTIFYMAAGVISALSLSSCASVLNLANNHSWKVGIDIVTTKPDPVTVTQHGKALKTTPVYKGDQFYVTRAKLRHHRKHIDLAVTQDNVTKDVHIDAKKVKGLFWMTGLFVIVDHWKGTLIKYPAIVYDDIKK